MDGGWWRRRSENSSSMLVEVDTNTLSVTERAVCVRGTSRHVDRTRPVPVRAFHSLLHYHSAAFAQCIQTFSESPSVLLEKLKSQRLWIELPYIPRLASAALNRYVGSVLAGRLIHVKCAEGASCGFSSLSVSFGVFVQSESSILKGGWFLSGG